MCALWLMFLCGCDVCVWVGVQAYIRAMTEGRSMRQQHKNRQARHKMLEAEVSL